MRYYLFLFSLTVLTACSSPEVAENDLVDKSFSAQVVNQKSDKKDAAFEETLLNMQRIYTFEKAGVGSLYNGLMDTPFSWSIVGDSLRFEVDILGHTGRLAYAIDKVDSGYRLMSKNQTLLLKATTKPI